MKQLYLIIPVYNGAQYIKNTVSEIERFFSLKDISCDIVWVDDGSTDDTITSLYKAISQSNISMSISSYEKNKGKGYAIQYALDHKKDTYQYIGFTDVELPYGLQPCIDAVLHMDTHHDIGISVGSRYSAHVSKAQYHWYRRLTHQIFRFFIPSSIRHFKDTQCGIKIFRQDVADMIFERIKTFRWVFDIELFVIAYIHKIYIYEIPVIIKPSCVIKKGGVSLFRHGLSLVYDMLLIYYAIANKKYE